MKPLHIVHCIYQFYLGGAESMLVDIANEQVAMGMRVSLVIISNQVDELLLSKVDRRVNVVRLNRPQGSKPLLMMMRLNAMMLRLRPDIIHAHHHKFGRLLMLFRRRMVYTVHELNNPMIYCSRTHMAAITEAVEQDVRARVPGASIRTVPNGIRCADIVAADHDGTTPPVFRVIQLGRITASLKGQDILIDALAILKERGITNIEVDFIGSGVDMASLKQRAGERGVAEGVHFCGAKGREYIYSHLCKYHIMCHPARFEGFGLIIAEAMAAGVPVVIPEGGGPWEVAAHGKYCTGYKPNTAEACADALLQVMTHYAEACAKAREARSYVERYDIAHTVEMYLRYYNDILQRKV